MSQEKEHDRREITLVLRRLNQGEGAAYDELVPLVYRELRRRARRYLSGQAAGHTLQPTALVHEAFIKLAGGGNGGDAGWRDSRHFYNAAAEVMRQILVSHARGKRALKRGGAGGRRELEAPVDQLPAHPEGVGPDGPDWEALDLALAELATRDERRYRVAMLRYFAGLTDAQVAAALGVSEKTVERDWATARAFLRARMEQPSVG